MYITFTGNENNRDVYMNQAYRGANGKSTSRIYKKLGKEQDLIAQFGGDREKMVAWAHAEAKKETELYKKQNALVRIELSPAATIPLNEKRSFNVGYLFLQQLCYELRLDNICRNIKNRHQFKYDLGAILTDQIYARILSPSSKLKSYDYCKSLLEPPKYALQDVYRSLSVMASESDYIQSELYKNSNFVHPRKTKILYYDCTNYYFEIEEESDDKKYGKSKEHRPNPIVTMGLFMDAEGIPLAFDIFPGNRNEQKTLKPLETKIIQDFECSEFIFCSDSALGGLPNRKFNSLSNRAYVITQSLRKMKKEDKEIALSPTQFRKLGSNKFINIEELDETNEDVYNTIYYKEVPVQNKDMDETVIVTYSPKYKAYQRKIRARQLERAVKIVNSPEKKRKGKNPNDPMRFVKKVSVTDDGEVAEKGFYTIDTDLVDEEEKYDGFYAVITNLEGDVGDILKINQRRWEIEENFRIMKTEFEARPVYVRRQDRIKAHFLTCYISLLIYRLLEKKLGETYTCDQLIETLRSMQVTQINPADGYIPAYERTEITDALHKYFGFRTDYEILRKSDVKSIIKKSKQKKD